MTTLDVLKEIQRIMIEKLIAKSDLIISVYSRPERSELSIFIQNAAYVVLNHEIFIDDNGTDSKERNKEAYDRVINVIKKHDAVLMAG